jgi:hypothetical protein
MDDGRWKMDMWMMEDGILKMEDGRWKIKDGRWKMKDGYMRDGCMDDGRWIYG